MSDTTQFTVYWPNGVREVIRGWSLANALEHEGYGQSAKLSIQIHREGNDDNYVWNQQTKSWEKKSFS